MLLLYPEINSQPYKKIFFPRDTSPKSLGPPPPTKTSGLEASRTALMLGLPILCI